MSPDEAQALARLLEQLGIPAEKCAGLAAQLDRRAAQLAERTGRSHEAALAHLLALMRQGASPGSGDWPR